MNNTIVEWDSLGHLQAARFIKEHTFPYWEGWNPYFFAGFPQGALYAPLFHYLVAALSYVLPIEIAFKLLVVLSVLALPLCATRFALRASLSEMQSCIFSMLTLLVCTLPITFCSTNNSVGGTLSSTFNTGLVTNALALPLLLLYLSQIARDLKTRSEHCLAGMFLGLVILTHTLTATLAIFFALIRVASDIFLKRGLAASLAHIVLAAASSAFWTVPFLVHLEQIETVKINLSLGAPSFLLLALGVVSLAYRTWRGDKPELGTISIYFLSSAILVLAGNFLPFALHVYRLILLPVLLALFFATAIIPKDYSARIAAGLFLLTSLALVQFRVAANEAFAALAASPQTTLLQNPANRTLIDISGEEQISPHYFQLTLPFQHKFFSTKGLFVESAINSPALLFLERLINSYGMIWGVALPPELPMREEDRFKLLLRLANLFMVNGIISHRETPLLSRLPEDPILESQSKTNLLLDRVGGTHSIPAWGGESRYFYVQKDRLTLLDRRYGYLKTHTFAKLDQEAPRYVLAWDNQLFYVKRYSSDLLQIDFTIPRSLTDTLKPEADLDPVIDLINRSSATKQEKYSISTRLARTAAVLEATNLSVALQPYAELAKTELKLLSSHEEPVSDSTISRDLYSFDFHYYQLPHTELVSIVSEAPQIVDPKFKAAAMYRSITVPEEQRLQVITSAKPKFSDHGAIGRISELRVSALQDSLSLDLEADHDLPLLVRISYFPKWRAYWNGSPAPVYRVAPGLMLVFGRGQLQMRYETQWYEYLARGASLTALLIVMLFGCRTLIKGRSGNALG